MIRFLVAAVLILAATPASGQAVPCAPRDVVLSTMLERYGEVLTGVGVAGGGVLVELLVAPGGATFTILATTASGISCLQATGEGWRTVAPVVPEQPT